MNQKLLIKSFLFNIFKSKRTFLVLLLWAGIINYTHAQCPCNTSSCTYSVSTSVATNYTITSGQTLCILPGGNVTGSITVEAGGTVCNTSNITPSSISFFTGGTFNNCGTITVGSGFTMLDATDYLYNCSGATIHFTSGSLGLNGGGHLINEGTLIFDNGGVTDNGGLLFINDGTITINNGGDMTVNGVANSFCNNGTINMTDVGSTFINNGSGSNNYGHLNTYDFSNNGDYFYNACTVNVTHDFSTNGGSLTGPTTAGQYGRFDVAGYSSHNATDVALSGSNLDFCDAGHPAGGWDTKNGGSFGVNLTYCVHTGTCIGTGPCVIPCTTPTAAIAGTTTICNGVSTTLTASGGTTYSWNTGATTSAITVSPGSTTTYTVTVSNGTCSATKVQTVTVNSVTPGMTGTTTVCSGVSTTLTGTGGGTYSWNTGATTTSITVTPGSTTTYTVTVTSASGCTGTKAQTVTVNTTPTPGITGTSTICSGKSTTLTGTGGGTYSWNTGATTTAITVTPGSSTTYTLTVTGSTGGCTATKAQTVTVNTTPTPGITGTTTVCNGVSTTLTGTGGGTYVWDNGATTTAITVTPGGTATYTVTVTSSAGCTTTTAQTVTVNANPSAGITGTDAICNGASTTLTGTGGGTYVWNTGSSTTAITVSPTSNTNYTVTVTNAAGCTATATQAVTVNAVPTTSISATNAACGGSTGTATVTASGSGTLTYLWSPGGQTTSSITGLSAGSYNVTVTDGNGCTKNASVSVNNLTGPTASFVSQTNILCNGFATGSATVTGTGGTGTLTYSWSPGGQTTATATGLTAGTYICTVTDGLGCAQGKSVTITQPSSYVAGSITSQTNVGCTGGATGSATVTGAGGTPTYTYLWSPGGKTTASVTGLTSGSYNVTITDANGCTTNQTVAITQPASGLGSNITSQTNVGCTGAATGSATVTGTGGTPAYTYSWSPGGYNTSSVTGLTTGAYTVTITDANGCTKQQTVAITQPASSLGSNISSQTNVGCTGAATGSATVTGTGGTPIYTYSWSPGGQTTATVSGLISGTYNVTITDANGCTKAQTVTITQPASSLGSTISSQTNVGCTGSATGSATVTGTGGTPTYTYLWSPGGQTTAAVTGLTSGSYNVTVTDANGCTQVQTVAITQPASAVSVGISYQDNVGCTGASTGVAIVTATGGTPGYTYNWSPGGQTSSTATGLSAGSYTCTVTDINGCTKAQAVTITQPASAIGLTVTSQSNVGCTGSATGSASVTGTGGTPTYSYTWAPSGGFSASETGLTAGTYTVTIVDLQGCSKSQSITITQPASALGSTISSVNATCGNSNGTASVTATGGTPGSGYLYNWSPSGGTNSTATGLSAGVYTVLITDANGCSQTSSVSVNNAGSPSVSILSQGDASCNGNATGSATVTVTGGTPGYNYNWTPAGGTGATATGLSAGTYNCTVTDLNGCIKVQSVTINEPTVLTSGISSQNNVGCTGSATGSASVTASGGTPTYTYSWSPGGNTTSSVSGLSSGSYNVTITDSHGCSKIQTVAITQPASSLGSSISSKTNVDCMGNATGNATVSGTGGTPAYTYNWQPMGGTGPTATGLTAGTYTVTLSDFYGCTKQQLVTITQPSASLTSSISSQTNVGCTGGATGSATLTVTGGTPTYTYNWSPGGFSDVSVTGLTSGAYNVIVTDANGCTTAQTVAITQPASALGSTHSSVNATCGQSNGTISLTATGGTPAYTYNWSPSGGTNSTATGLSAGTYSVTVTDANGCTKNSLITLNNANGPTVGISSQTDVLCNGAGTGSATVSATGGTGTLTYLWSPTGATTATITGLTSGTYVCTVTDSSGCIQAQTVTITQPTAGLNSTVSSQQNVGCTGSATGTATVSVTGGTPSYTYNWIPGSYSTATVSGLVSGNYNVTITDNNGCTALQVVTITEPASVLGSTISSQTDVGCKGNATGTATVTGTGGTPAYTYSWLPAGGSGPSATGLTAGTYTVSLTDANGCTTSQIVTINQPSVSLTSGITSQQNVSCNGGSNSSATITASGGTPGYSYNWSPSGGTTNTISGLIAGTYICTVTDTNGCTAQQTVTITQASKLSSLIASQTNAKCNGDSTGVATVSGVGGTPSYKYTWTPNVSSTNTATKLPASTYTVVITDSLGCTNVTTVTITQPAPFILKVSSSAVVCSGQSVTLSVTPTGGTAPFTYTWLPSGPNVSPLVPTTYKVIGTDSSGCPSLMDSITVTPLVSPVAGFDTLSSGMFYQKYNFIDQSKGSIKWYWDFGDGGTSTLQNPYHTYPGAGTYTVTQVVAGASGCYDTITKVLVIGPGILIPNVFTPNHDGVNDEFWIPSSGFDSFSIEIYNRWGTKLWETDSGEIRWDGRTTAGVEVPDGTYYFILKAVLKDGGSGKNYDAKGFINLHRSGVK